METPFDSSPVRLGLMTPENGVASMYGLEILRAATIACAEVNDAGGVLGRPLELLVEDDGSLPETAVAAALRLVDERGCTAIIGNLLSSARIAVASLVAEPRAVPYLNFSFSEGSVRTGTYFQLAALPNQQIGPMIPFGAERFGGKMYFAGNNYEWPRGSIDAAKRVLDAHGGSVVGEEYHPIGVSELELERLLDRVERAGTDIFVPYFAGADQIALLARLAKRRLKEKVVVMTGHFDEVMARALPPEAREGIYASSTYFMSVDTVENRAFLERLASTAGVAGLFPDGDGVLTSFGESAYHCVHAFARAANAARSLESAAIVRALEDVSTLGPQGLVRIDAGSHHAHVGTFLGRCRADGTFEIVERFGVRAPVIPERYAMRSSIPPALPGRASSPDVGRTSEVDPVLSAADAAVIATDTEGTIVLANRAASHLFGYDEGELAGMSIGILIPPEYRQRHASMVRTFAQGERSAIFMGQRGNVTGYRKDGSLFPASASLARLERNGTLLLVATVRDETEKHRVDASLRWEARHDALTQLPNRLLVRERLEEALERSARQGTRVALLAIDLDGFKAVNDGVGHAVGDHALVAVANRLVSEVRPGDMVGRLGSDEFVVLCEQVVEQEEIAKFAERLQASLGEPLRVDGHSLALTASIGVALGAARTHTSEALVREAEAALGVMKARGRDGYRFFDAEMHEEASRRIAVANGLRIALEHEELRLVCQPIVSASTRRVIGGELLLRWSPPGGEVSPAYFVPIAEMTGSIVSIGEWVFAEACRIDAALRRRFGSRAPYLSVNVSPRQLARSNLAETFGEIMRAHDTEASRIILEITETALMLDVDANLEVLRKLAALGLRVAVDDFGTGYSSLAQLLRLKPSAIKIDREFVSRLDIHHESSVITSAVMGMARALDLTPIAEGVENEAQLEALRRLGCDAVQGFLLHRPMSIEQFAELVGRELASERGVA